MEAFLFAFIVLMGGFFLYFMWLTDKAMSRKDRLHKQQIDDLLDRLAYAQGKPYNLPERQKSLAQLSTDPEETPEEGWHEL